MYIYQGGIDPISGENLKDNFEAHHIVAWSEGGKTEINNLMLVTKESHHKLHNQSVSNEYAVKKRNELWEKNKPTEFKRYKALMAINEII